MIFLPDITRIGMWLFLVERDFVRVSTTGFREKEEKQPAIYVYELQQGFGTNSYKGAQSRWIPRLILKLVRQQLFLKCGINGISHISIFHNTRTS